MSYSRTLQYPGVLLLALCSGHYLVTDRSGSGECGGSGEADIRGESQRKPQFAFCGSSADDVLEVAGGAQSEDAWSAVWRQVAELSLLVVALCQVMAVVHEPGHQPA